mmetsp:Transcript_92591/g.239104  ORF Transcript_92591/g.239104 Transcript_92591/m.239104 type:complete len:166 (-) Transcript_92591:1092-1589(-)
MLALCKSTGALPRGRPGCKKASGAWLRILRCWLWLCAREAFFLHCEYQSPEDTHVSPSAQHVGPSQPLPPHCCHSAAHGPWDGGAKAVVEGVHAGLVVVADGFGVLVVTGAVLVVVAGAAVDAGTGVVVGAGVVTGSVVVGAAVVGMVEGLTGARVVPVAGAPTW